MRANQPAKHQLQPEKGVSLYEKSSPKGTMVSEAGGGRDDPGIGAEIPLQPLEAYWGADIHPQSLEETVQKQVAA